jgi:two-component system chemotaxis sensor kinase CheA
MSALNLHDEATLPPPSTAGGAGVDRLPADADLDLLPEFLTESRECMAHAEAALLALEVDPTDGEAMNRAFRAFHTVKGTAACLGLARITRFAHEAESLLSRVRDRELTFTRDCADLALQSTDMLRELFSGVDRALRGDGDMPVPSGYVALHDALANYGPTRVAAGEAEPARVGVDDIFPPTLVAGAPAGRAPAAGVPDAGALVSTIRVRSDRFHRLIDLVGELVIVQGQIAGDEAIRNGTPRKLLRHVLHTGAIVHELQTLALSMHMVPLGPIFQRLARVVRDTATQVGKSVRFVTVGDDLELHRTVVDRLGDPLVHMVRNAVDHGIEPSSERTAHGKPAHGTVRVHAYGASGHVVVELSDDGRGLHRDTILRRAVAMGLVGSDTRLSDRRVFNLLFAPGFSTAEEISDISGRGVGLDVARRNLEGIGGRVDVVSVPGKGTTFIIRLPHWRG